MKSLFKILKIVIVSLVLLAFICSMAVYWYLTTDWKNYYTNDEIKSFAVEINNSPKLSMNFYNIYDHLYNNGRHKSNTSFYLSAFRNLITGDTRQYGQSPFVKAAYYFPKKKGMSEYGDFKLSWGLEKFATAEKCFDFAMNIDNQELLKSPINGNIKSIILLNDTTEILQYLVITKSPSLYRHYPDKLNQAVANLYKKLDAK